MLRIAAVCAMASAVSAFTPSSMLPIAATRAAVSRGPVMQLYGEGKLQGITVNAIPKSDRPASLDGTLVGDVGFDPLGISSLVDLRWLREAELKHGRVCMLAATGLIVQDVYQFPGVSKTFGDLKVTALHDAAVKQGAMQQLLLWLGLLEIFGAVAIIQMLQGSDRQPGDFGFDPLGLAKNPSSLPRRQLTELKNGRLAMIAFSGMLHHYFITGKGPIQLITGN